MLPGGKKRVTHILSKTNTGLNNNMSIKIYTDWVNEAKSNTDLQGFVFNYGVIYIGAYPTFPQFASALMEEIGSTDEEHGFIPDAENLAYKVEEWIGFPDDSFYWNFWHGLNPKSNKPFLDRVVHTSNAFLVVDDYQSAFTNAKPVMSKNRAGNHNDISYISKSIDADPDLLEAYLATEDLEQWELDAILSNLKMDPKMIQYYTRVRKTM